MKAPLRSLVAARGLRDFGDGFFAVLLPVYLTALGYSSSQIGVLAGTALFGSALLTLAIGVLGARYEHRNLLIFTAGLMTLTGVAFSLTHSYLVLLLVAFLGSVNPSASTASFFVPVEHAVLAREAGDADRTQAFARYSLVGGLAGAAGALAAATPHLLMRMGWSQLEGLRAMFVSYAVFGLAGGLLYSRLPLSPSTPRAEQPPFSAHRAKSSTSWLRFSASTPLPEASWSSRCSRSGSFTRGCRSRRRAPFSSCRGYCLRSPIPWRHALRSVSAW